MPVLSAPADECLADLPLQGAMPLAYEPAQATTRPDRSIQIAQALVLTALLAAPSLMAVHSASVTDNDIWWHLRTGEWIAQHHAIPRVDVFSSSAAGQPWSPYSWLFDLLLLPLLTRLGLTGMVAYTAAMVLAITCAINHLIRRLQADFPVGVLLTFAAAFTLARLYTPRPWLFTILLFTIEMDILMHARKTGRTRELYWLPLIFLVWANIHIQFVDGLLMLGVAVVEAVAASRGVGPRPRIPVGTLLATLLRPCSPALRPPWSTPSGDISIRSRTTSRPSRA